MAQRLRVLLRGHLQQGRAQLLGEDLHVGAGWCDQTTTTEYGAGGSLARRMHQLALQDRGGSAAHNAILALRCCEKLPLLPTTVADAHWLAVKAIDRISSPNAPPPPEGVDDSTGPGDAGTGMGPLGLGTCIFRGRTGSGILHAGRRPGVPMQGLAGHHRLDHLPR